METAYIGEHLWPGWIGRTAVASSFVFCLFAMVSYYLAFRRKDEDWKRSARLFFRLHAAAIIGIASSLFYIIFNHYFEYNYAFRHSSEDLPLKYILSCFWEGQEGSFLLWLFWHSVLGLVLIRTLKSWENTVMMVFTSAQLILCSMLLGVYVAGIKIGSNPFMLLRDNPDMMHLPVFTNPSYPSLIEGNGLNPLLQNYWMTIHPPTLFLGFASTLVPFSFAMSALIEKRHIGWLAKALPWTTFSVLILGTGVLMGGAWAYEALSFGGFWAWDPVENASLVPWLFMVAALHLMMINKSRGDRPTSLLTTYAITITAFLLILYSTYLTRSGILGESSVHSFADGMPGQLIFFMLVFLIATIALVLFRRSSIPVSKEEEHLMSREFWMLIGSIILVISAFQIIFTTSIPVLNALFGTSMAPPLDALNHYNSWQIPFSIVVALLMAFTQFMSYRRSKWTEVRKKLIPGTIAAVLTSAIIALSMEIRSWIYIGLLFASVLAVVLNLDYFLRVLKGKVKNAGASIAHVGFGMVMLGALLSAGLQTVISRNTSGIDIRMDGDEDDANLENILLYRNDTLPMGPYLVTYAGKQKSGINILYAVSYTEAAHPEKGSFSLFPRIQLNKNMGNVPEPDTKHWLAKDLFTHVTYVNEDDFGEKKAEEYEALDTIYLKKGDSAIVAPYLVILESLTDNADAGDYPLEEGDIAIKATLSIDDFHGNVRKANPIMVVRNNKLYFVHSAEKESGLRFSLIYIETTTGKMTFAVEKDKNRKEDFIIMKAVIFPFINVLWIGCIVMITGMAIAIYRRVKTASGD